MAATDVLPLTVLAEKDIAGCMALSAEAGWNQTADDWAMFMRRGTVFGVRDGGGKPIATGAIFPYPNQLAWVSMVLVTASQRRQRIGTRILETCCAEITRRGLVALLDATPAGERVYRPLGFQPMFNLLRWQGIGGGGVVLPQGIRTMSEADLAAAAALDAAVFGEYRLFLLQDYFRRAPQFALVAQNLDGFIMARPGRIATQIGPLVAANESIAADLLDAALGVIGGPIFLDVLERWDHLKSSLQHRGFTVQRPYVRMGLNCSALFGDVERLFGIGAPEFG